MIWLLLFYTSAWPQDESDLYMQITEISPTRPIPTIPEDTVKANVRFQQRMEEVKPNSSYGANPLRVELRRYYQNRIFLERPTR